jgi:hypothetical protein
VAPLVTGQPPVVVVSGGEFVVVLRDRGPARSQDPCYQSQSLPPPLVVIVPLCAQASLSSGPSSSLRSGLAVIRALVFVAQPAGYLRSLSPAMLMPLPGEGLRRVKNVSLQMTPSSPFHMDPLRCDHFCVIFRTSKAPDLSKHMYDYGFWAGSSRKPPSFTLTATSSNLNLYIILRSILA